MPNFSMFPQTVQLLSGQTATTTGTSGVLTIPVAQSYRMTVELLTASSTTTNFSLSLFSSSDGGTVYHGLLSFNNLTTSGQAQTLVFKPYIGAGEAAISYTAPVPILGSTDWTTGTTIVNNGPFDPRFLKARWQLATTGTVTFNLKCDCSVAGQGE